MLQLCLKRGFCFITYQHVEGEVLREIVENLVDAAQLTFNFHYLTFPVEYHRCR